MTNEGAPELLAELIDCLGNPDGDIQREAENKLIKIGQPAVDVLVAATSDPNSLVRWRAAYALGEIGDARAYDDLVALLKDKDGQVRVEAVDAVAKIGDDRVIEPLTLVIRDAAVDAHAATHAAHHLMYKGSTALPALLDIWRTGSLEARLEVAYPIGHIGDPSAADALAEQLDDPHLRLPAASALGMLGDKRALDVLITCLRSNWQEYCEGESAVEEGIKALGAIAVESLLEITRAGSPQSRQEAVRLLGEIRHPAAIDTLHEMLSHPALRHEALIALGRCGDERVVPELLGLLREADEEWDISVADAISTFGEMAWSELEAASKSHNKFAREMVTAVLSDIANERSIDVLARMLNDRDAGVRDWVVDALWEIGREDGTNYAQQCAEILESHMDDDDYRVRANINSRSADLRMKLGQTACIGLRKCDD